MCSVLDIFFITLLVNLVVEKLLFTNKYYSSTGKQKKKNTKFFDDRFYVKKQNILNS